MKKELEIIPDFDDIIFEIRNKEYGSYVLRRQYNRNVLISTLIGMIISSIVIITPYLNAKALEKSQKRAERQVQIKMENLDLPDEAVAPPPPPPPSESVQQVKYIPPVVVDSVKPEERVQLLTADQAQIDVKDEEAVDFVREVKEEVRDDDAETEPFIVVEEMPVPAGGLPGLYKYISENLHYPLIAQENNIQGKIIVKFCVTAKGGIDQVSILRGIDAELDAEAIRVVKTLPAFKPGKQGGKAVPVWFTVPIIFQIK